LYGAEAEATALAWSWVVEQLEASGTYWVNAVADRHPHPRPVWGVWVDDSLHLSIGSPVVARQAAADPRVTVHLDSGTDVVIVEGEASIPAGAPAPSVVDAYDAKYDWHYDIEEYGPFTVVRPERVLAWHSAGWAGRDGFQQTGRWTFG
jgi:hypothetical protein